MGNAKTNLEYLKTTKSLIKQAIIDKGVEVSDTDTFRSYKDKIDSIETGGGGGISSSLDTSVSTGIEFKSITTNITSKNGSSLKDLTQVGSPSLDIEGVASGFSTANYYTMTAFDNIDMYILVTPTNVSNRRAFISFDGTASNWIGAYSGYFAGYFSGTYARSTSSMTVNTSYWICCSIRDTVLNCYILTDNGYTKDTVPKITDESWTHALTDKTIAKADTFMIGTNSSVYCIGSMDLLNSFGEYDGETIWTPVKRDED